MWRVTILYQTRGVPSFAGTPDTGIVPQPFANRLCEWQAAMPGYHAVAVCSI
jgi:hypothetical protein